MLTADEFRTNRAGEFAVHREPQKRGLVTSDRAPVARERGRELPALQVEPDERLVAPRKEQTLLRKDLGRTERTFEKCRGDAFG